MTRRYGLGTDAIPTTAATAGNALTMAAGGAVSGSTDLAGGNLIMSGGTATGAGTLFYVDLRLRPNGESGLLVTSLESFRRYQIREGDAANTAWVWEHQALSRARYCAGDAESAYCRSEPANQQRFCGNHFGKL